MLYQKKVVTITLFQSKTNNILFLKEEDTIAFVQEEQIRSIVAPLGQIVRKDLPPNMRAVIIEKLKSAIIQYSDFACMLSFMVHAIMMNFTMFDNNTTVDLDTIIPIEFQTDSRPVSLPSIPRIPTSNDITYNDYKNLFSFTHLQVISTLNFGTTGVQSKTLTNHPLWGDIHKRTKSKTSPSQVENAALQEDEDDFDQQFQDFIDLAKSVNTTIKKSVVKQLSTNLDNMYMNNKKFNKTLDKLLLVLLKMNFQPKKERERRRFMNQQHDNQKAPAIPGLTRNKKRSLLKRYQKQLVKHQLKQQTSKAERVTRKINYIKSLKARKQVIDKRKANETLSLIHI